MSKLRQYSFFVAAVEHRSLTAAAQVLGVSVAAVSKQIRALEMATDTQLLNRTTSGVTPTDLGRRFYRRCKQVLSDVESAEHDLRAAQATMTGRISLTLSRAVAVPLVYDALAAFSTEHPAIRFDLIIDETLQNLQEEHIDFALRVGRVDEVVGLVAIPLRHVRPVLCATPSYLRRLRGGDIEPAWMSTVPVRLSPAVQKRLKKWGVDLTAAPSHTGTDLDAVQGAVRGGLCMGVLLDLDVAAALADGRLVEVHPQEPLPSKRMYLLYSRERPMLRRHRELKRFLSERLRSEG